MLEPNGRPPLSVSSSLSIPFFIMNLCWLIPDDRGGGTAAVALSCCRQAARAGHSVTLLMLLPATGHLDEHVEGFEIASLGLPGQSPEAPTALVDWLRAHPQDVLFLNSTEEVTPAVPFLPRDTRCVDVIHDTARRYWQRVLDYESALDGVFAVSETVAQRFRQHLQSPERLQVVHNGTVFPERPATPPEARAPDLIFLGGSKSFKGADDLLPLWPDLLEAGFSGSLHWYGGLDPSLRDRVKQLPASDRIIDHGRVPRSQIFDRAGSSSALLMLSRAEPFGMVTIEAMGMGCLPVSWDIETGTREIVTPGKTGFFAPLGDSNALAQQAVRACQPLSDMRSRATDVARSRFSEAAMWERYEDALKQPLSTSPTRPHAGESPSNYAPPRRYFQMLPAPIKRTARRALRTFPTLGYWFRNWRGF